MSVPLYVVDAFTNRPFSGNPAGVCLLAAAAPESWMQEVAAEVNLAETAFVVARADDDHDLRWFTPTVEVELCGHATLATAHVLGGCHRFHTRSGVLTTGPGAEGTIEVDLPAAVVHADPSPGRSAWARAFGLGVDRVLGVHSSPAGWVLVEVASADDVRAAVTDRDALLALGGFATVVADTTGDRGEPFDSVCRTFVPGAGIDEDPVTGSSHCVIAPWLAARWGRTELLGHQASSRGGVVGMRVNGDRVVLSGHAVTVTEGQLLPPP
ncbi:PhzF family phenazine biosynthesis protein [soil metagenome]